MLCACVRVTRLKSSHLLLLCLFAAMDAHLWYPPGKTSRCQMEFVFVWFYETECGPQLA